MDIRELVEIRRKENRMPKELKKSSFSLFEIVAFIYFLLLLIVSGLSYLTSDSFKLATSETDECHAYITEIDEESPKRRYYYGFYTVDSDTFDLNFSLPGRSMRKGPAVNDSIKITYIVTDPEVHFVQRLKRNKNSFWPVLPLIVIMMACMLPFLISFIRNRKRIKERTKLWENGDLTLGTLVMVKKEKRVLPVVVPKFEIVVDYEIGTEAKRSSTIVDNTWLLEQWRQGEIVTLLVDPQSPDKVIAIEEFVY